MAGGGWSRSGSGQGEGQGEGERGGDITVRRQEAQEEEDGCEGC